MIIHNEFGGTIAPGNDLKGSVHTKLLFQCWVDVGEVHHLTMSSISQGLYGEVSALSYWVCTSAVPIMMCSTLPAGFLFLLYPVECNRRSWSTQKVSRNTLNFHVDRNRVCNFDRETSLLEYPRHIRSRELTQPTRLHL